MKLLGNYVARKLVNGTAVSFYIGPGNKKYTAVVKNSQTGQLNRFHFGDKRYMHYKDKISNTYSALNHLDKDRRRLYRLRHRQPGDFPSASYFAWHYLW